MRWLALVLLALVLVVACTFATPLPTSTPLPTPTSAPFPMQSPSPTLTSTLTPTPQPTQTDEQVAAEHLSRSISWFSSPPDTVHADAAELITTIWLHDADLGDAVAQIPWVADGVRSDELEVVDVLLRIHEVDVKASEAGGSIFLANRRGE